MSYMYMHDKHSWVPCKQHTSYVLFCQLLTNTIVVPMLPQSISLKIKGETTNQQNVPIHLHALLTLAAGSGQIRRLLLNVTTHFKYNQTISTQWSRWLRYLEWLGTLQSSCINLPKAASAYIYRRYQCIKSYSLYRALHPTKKIWVLASGKCRNRGGT